MLTIVDVTRITAANISADKANILQNFSVSRASFRCLPKRPNTTRLTTNPNNDPREPLRSNVTRVDIVQTTRHLPCVNRMANQNASMA